MSETGEARDMVGMRAIYQGHEWNTFAYSPKTDSYKLSRKVKNGYSHKWISAAKITFTEIPNHA